MKTWILLSLLPALKLATAKLFLTFQQLLPINLAVTPGLAPFNASSRIVVQKASLSLTSAQLLALFTTGVVVVPAPGVGLQIIPLTTILQFDGGSVAYLDGGGGAISLSVGAGVSQALANNNIILVTVSPNRRTQVVPWLTTLGTAANPPAEDNAALSITKATANPTAGNGTLRVTVYYVIEPTT